jgi:Protein of unknown function DUF72
LGHLTLQKALFMGRFPSRFTNSYYGTPAPSTVESWYRKTTADFVFAAKVPHTNMLLNRKYRREWVHPWATPDGIRALSNLIHKLSLGLFRLALSQFFFIFGVLLIYRVLPRGELILPALTRSGALRTVIRFILDP